MNADIRFVDFSKKFMEDYAKESLSVTTYKRYETLLTKINEEIGELKLSQIKPPHIREFKKAMEKVTRKVPIRDEHGKIIKYENKKLATKTQLHYFRLVSAILSKAVYWDYITENPAAKVEAPKVIKRETEYLDIETIKTIIKLLEKEPIQYKVFINLLLYSGIRRRGTDLHLLGMTFGLETDKILKITKTAQYVSGQGLVIKEPKTFSSKREIVLSERNYKIIKRI